ncbi:MAG: anhydro-N-acetylmuramic acid kinase [Elainella sp. Prado103]|jgi:anhydro-N-acetylmuramic acid kinase|nr:anhydro-N-acetylmuramic acid kinase [Elainella sp. Prado103]
MSLRVIGLISGTSVDGIDAALVELSGSQADLQVNLLQGETYPYPAALRSQILDVCAGEPLSMSALAELDDAIAEVFAAAALNLQAKHAPVDLIGSHGQTAYHRPPQGATLGYSLQLGRGALIAHRTGITTISNFRAADLAVGGQGAPLVPPVDACLLRHDQLDRCLQNLGGIGNVTYLPAQSRGEPICGWDTGPGNALIDLAVSQFTSGAQTFDRNGAWAAQGMPCTALVNRWMEHPFFQQAPPKSTGRELFGVDYLHQCLQDASAYPLSQADILASLTELTAASIVESYRRFLPRLPAQVALCGGGSHNTYLQQRLQANLESTQVCSTDDLGLNADFKEAIAFAVLAYWRYQGLPGNLPEVTGANCPVLLGEIHQGGAYSA